MCDLKIISYVADSLGNYCEKLDLATCGLSNENGMLIVLLSTFKVD